VKKSCIIAPIHAPHFLTYGIDFIGSYNRYFNDSDIFLIFSSKEESDQFKLIAGDLKYESIVCTEQLGVSPITQKKFFGLKYIFENTSFDRVGVIDVDTAFLKYIDYDKCFEDYIKNKKIYSGFGTQPHVKNIISSPLKFFEEEDREKIKKATHDLNAYFWFNELPIYNKKYFLDFLDYIDYKNSKYKLVCNDFDFIVYAYYLIIKNFATLDFLKIDNEIISLPIGFIEEQKIIDPIVFQKIVDYIKPMWLCNCMDPEYMENVFIKLHLDRN
jgi:hypothetical protein